MLYSAEDLACEVYPLQMGKRITWVWRIKFADKPSAHIDPINRGAVIHFGTAESMLAAYASLGLAIKENVKDAGGEKK